MAIDSHTNFKVSLMNAMRAFFSKFQKDQRGVTAIEYGLIALAMAALITVAFSTSQGGFISKLKAGFDNVGNSIENMQTIAPKEQNGHK
jgi:pilus assembly protein Flp/PilA